ncbi:MAG: nicotinate phosphoribosyltransferase, partial [Acidobacteriota bacterium]
ASFRFTGNIRGIPEGTVVFPNEPIVQVTGNLIECQLVETVLLCHINFQTLIATKAARIWEASKRGTVIEFGLRRAQGPDGALSACRAAHIGGVAGTSNVLAAALTGMPAKGTHAHSWIQSFDSELEAFREYARIFPETSILLVDTYDTLNSGLPNAIKVARELEKRGHRLMGIRLDSGDIASLSQKAREMLNSESLSYVKIVASNELDEFSIKEILARGGKVDIWGVGTRLITGAGAEGCALGGIYKRAELNGVPKIKLSSDLDKATTPGLKKIVRFYNESGGMEADVVAENSEDLSRDELRIVDPANPDRPEKFDGSIREDLLHSIVESGGLVYGFPNLDQIRKRRTEQLSCLCRDCRCMDNAAAYKVLYSENMWLLRERMVRQETLR